MAFLTPLPNVMSYVLIKGVSDRSFRGFEIFLSIVWQNGLEDIYNVRISKCIYQLTILGAHSKWGILPTG